MGNHIRIHTHTQRHMHTHTHHVVFFFSHEELEKLITLLFHCCFCFCSVVQSCLALCDPMDCCIPGFPVLHHLPEFPYVELNSKLNSKERSTKGDLRKSLTFYDRNNVKSHRKGPSKRLVKDNKIVKDS